MEVNLERLREVLTYDPASGVFTWRKTLSARAVAGKEAGTVNPRGYRVIRVDRQGVAAHRAAWLMTYGVPPSGVIDHIDGNPSNNRIQNLRDVSQFENTRNCKVGSNNRSGYPGVYLNKTTQKWYAQIGHDFKTINLGTFQTFDQAKTARQTAEALFGYVTRT